MKGALSRARSSPRGGGEAVVKEKEPFCVGPYRSKSASAGRKPRRNSENVPPEHSNHVAEGMSPVSSKAGMSKAPRSSKEMFRSVALRCRRSLPGLPGSKRICPEPFPRHGHYQGSNIKLKINWDTPTDHVLMPATLETSSADSVVKVNTRIFSP